MSISRTIVALAWLATGCTTPMVRTSSEPANASELRECSTFSPKQKCASTVSGVPYYLPRTMLPITVSGQFVTVPGAPKDAQDDPAYKEYQLRVVVGSTVQQPDPGAAMFLEYLPSPMHDDDLGFGVGTSMLLETGTAQSRDRTGDVLSKLAELTAQIAKLATGGPFSIMTGSLKTAGTPTDKDRRKACTQTLSAFTVTEFVDLSGSIPADAGEIETKLTADMERAMFLPGFSASRVAPSTIVLSALDQPQASAQNAFAVKQEPRKGGVAFRKMTPRSLSLSLDTKGVSVRDDGGNTVACSLVASFEKQSGIGVVHADPSATFWVDVSRTPFVEKKIVMNVKDGVLSGLQVVKPSEVLAGISIPVEVLKTIASIPGEILSIKVKEAEGEKGIAAAEASLIETQLKLLKDQMALEALRSGTPGTDAAE